MMWKSKNNIRLKSQIGLELWETCYDDDIDIKRTWESITENIKASTIDSLGYY
jgi:hypothetical protein